MERECGTEAGEACRGKVIAEVGSQALPLGSGEHGRFQLEESDLLRSANLTLSIHST